MPPWLVGCVPGAFGYRPQWRIADCLDMSGGGTRACRGVGSALSLGLDGTRIVIFLTTEKLSQRKSTIRLARCSKRRVFTKSMHKPERLNTIHHTEWLRRLRGRRCRRPRLSIMTNQQVVPVVELGREHQRIVLGAIGGHDCGQSPYPVTAVIVATSGVGRLHY
jgi:hypothetical protein